jgi:hypothetical protein
MTGTESRLVACLQTAPVGSFYPVGRSRVLAVTAVRAADDEPKVERKRVCTPLSLSLCLAPG